MYITFRKKVKEQDERNEFGTEETVNQVEIPEVLQAFYKQANPLDVEVVQEDLTAIKFYPLASLESLQAEYDFSPEKFIFATHEGDPVYVQGEKVYTEIHGSRDGKPKLIADSFTAYLNEII